MIRDVAAIIRDKECIALTGNIHNHFVTLFGATSTDTTVNTVHQAISLIHNNFFFRQHYQNTSESLQVIVHFGMVPVNMKTVGHFALQSSALIETECSFLAGNPIQKLCDMSV